MSEGPADFYAAHHVEESPAERRSRMARQQADRDERQAEREEARDAMLFRYSQLGVSGRSLADVAADASRAADEQDRLDEARRTIDQIERHRSARLDVQRYEAEQVAAVSRAAGTLDPVQAASRRAADAVEAMLSGAWQSRRAGQILRSAPRARPPFGAGAPADSHAGEDAARARYERACAEIGTPVENALTCRSDPGYICPVHGVLHVRADERVIYR